MMPTIASGQSVSVYVPLASSMTFTPASGGRMSINGRTADGGAIVPREIYSATTISVDAGSTLSLEAQGGDASYTDPALTSSQVAALQPKAQILAGASAGQDSGWVLIGPHPERLFWQLDSGTTSTQFTVDISADGDTSLAQAFTGTWAASATGEFSPPLMFTNPQARYFRVTVVAGGPLSVYRCA